MLQDSSGLRMAEDAAESVLAGLGTTSLDPHTPAQHPVLPWPELRARLAEGLLQTSPAQLWQGAMAMHCTRIH